MDPRPPTTRLRGARSHRQAVATSLPPADATSGRDRQLSLSIGEPTAAAAARRELTTGVVHVPGWLDLAAQRSLAGDFRRWAAPPAGLRHPRMPTGHLMSVQSVCLGWHWQPYAYSRTADDTDGAPVKPLPASLIQLAEEAVGAAYGDDSPEAQDYAPDAALVNLYGPGARLGLHQDGEEPADAPVVTISLGDTGIFRCAGVDRRTGPFTDVAMRSGDLLVFGGPNRRIYHGVPKILDGTGPDAIGLPPGRLSISVRQTGLTG